MGRNSHAPEVDSSTATSASGTAGQTIETCSDLSAFFRETLCRALTTRGLRPGPRTEHYLVLLLSQLGHDTQALSASFVELSLEAQTAERRARLEKLRTIGDHALSYSGLFDAHRERHGIARSYVLDVGRSAYHTACQLASASSRAQEREQASVFCELSSGFDSFAEVLDDVRESTALGTKDDVLSLYERFVKTGSPVLQQRLKEHGVLSIGSPDNDVSDS